MTRPSDTLLAWAAVGSRISGFHHDSASKLQSMMMALDEAQDLLGDSNPDVHRALDTALSSLRELHTLLTDNRALAKAPVRKDVPLAEVLAVAGRRVGVTLQGTIPAVHVHVSIAAVGHALSLLVDAAAGILHGARTLDIAVRETAGRVELTLSGQSTGTPVADAILVATWLLEREGGAVFSAPRGFVVHLPTSATSSAASP